MDISKYVGKTIIAWYYYNPNFERETDEPGTISYVYPIILKKSAGKIEAIKDCKNEFPEKGRIEVKLKDGLTSENLYTEVGDIVEITINKKDPEYREDKNNRYSLKYNPSFRKDRSEIWIEKFSGKGFTQVISLSGNLDDVLNKHKIDFSEKIYTNEIMIFNGDKFYGPFEYDSKDDYITLTGKKEYNYFISEYKENELLNYTYGIYNPEGNVESSKIIRLIDKTFIQNPTERSERIDCIDESKLIDILVTILKNREEYTKNEIKKFKNTINELIEHEQGVYLDDERKNRIENLLESINPEKREKENLVSMFVNSALNNKNLSKEIAQYVCENHFDDYIEVNSQELKRYREKKKELTEDIEKLEEDKNCIDKELRDARDNLDKFTEDELLKKEDVFEKLNKDTDILKEEKEKLQKEVLELQGDTNQIKDLKKYIEKLEIRKEVVDEEFEKKQENLNEKKKKLEDQLQELNNAIGESVKKFKSEAEIVIRELDKNFLEEVFREINGEEIYEIKSFDKTKLYEQSLSGEEIIGIVEGYLKDKANRDISYNDVVNYLTCIGQGFITTFAGQPGAGKTSLCSLLAKSLGLAGEDGNKRYVEVSVERGWTSHKDFIGYYNPLTKKFEKSNAEIFDAFERINKETEEDPTAPMLILLDEANLSPIEHYWAAFIKNCDFDSTVERTINLGGNKKWNLPKSLRFLATVNFDHTTEELSSRFLNRSWVIVLEPGQIDEDSFITESVDNAERVISYRDFINAFGEQPKESDELDDKIADKWKNISAIFKENDMPIMPRNVKMILYYCHVDCKYMHMDTPETRFVPLDFAVAQKILPTINGSGENLEKLIEDLDKEFDNGMPICAKIIKRMKEKARDNMGYYQFFAI